jgi:hypothetical protein
MSLNDISRCVIDTRNVLNGVNENPKVTRNIIINILLKNTDKYLGLESAFSMLQMEDDFDETDIYGTTKTFIGQYVEGLRVRISVWSNRIWARYEVGRKPICHSLICQWRRMLCNDSDVFRLSS